MSSKLYYMTVQTEYGLSCKIPTQSVLPRLSHDDLRIPSLHRFERFIPFQAELYGQCHRKMFLGNFL